jgi:riboflavin synthase
VHIHIAMFKWKDAANPLEIEKAVSEIRGLRNKVPGIIDIRCGANRHAESKGLTHAIVVLAESKQALDAYREHPEHRRAASVIARMEADGLGCDFEDNLPLPS